MPTGLPEPFFHVTDVPGMHEFFSACRKENNALENPTPTLKGRCYICRDDVDFGVSIPDDGSHVNWRETLLCPHCCLINRWRSCLHVFEEICQPTRDDRIYLTETLTPVFQNLRTRYPSLVSSEYFPDSDPGELVDTHLMPVRNEDITELTFDDASFESVLCFDVLEHVPDYRAALREFYRILGSGGQLLVSVPFSFVEETLVRASIDESGNIEHHVEPSYHGDPLSDEGVLSFYDFGLELLGDLHDAGFQEYFLLAYNSKSWGYPNDNVIFVGRKLKSSVKISDMLKSAGRRTISHTREVQQATLVKIRSALLSVRKRVGLRIKPNSSDYSEKIENEKDFFKEYEEVHDLPEIFHYWSNKYLAPAMSDFGFGNPVEFFINHVRDYVKSSGPGKVQILSIGSGNCDLEVKIGKELLRWGHGNFVIECMDLNPDMLERGMELAATEGLSSHFRFSRDDFNHWQSVRKYGCVIANQSLHHVMNLEGLFDSIKRSLEPEGVFLVSDMIGRNGHMRWPEAMRALLPFWDELPDKYRYNRLIKRYEQEYINHDCSTSGFEGIRAQDILPLLMERFNFDFFFPFGNIIFVFIDRPFGHNFDAAADWDRDFIDRVHKCDEAGMISGELKPTSMLAVLSCKDLETQLRHPALSPQHCLRVPHTNDRRVTRR
jgi:ubiquinone/menaquinone biosynthesis C-methylase UbiE